MASDPRPASVILPTQGRSRESYERLMRAAGELFETRDFDSTPVSEIARRAGMTVGAFYARFPSKEALLRHAEDLLVESWGDLLPAWKEADVEGGTLESAVRGLIARLIAEYRRRRGFMRALVLRSQSDPELAARLGALTQHTIADAVTQLLRHRREIGHPSPETAVEFGSHVVRSVLRQRIALSSEIAKGDDALLEEELAHVYLAYLRCGGQSITPSRGS